MGTWLTKKSKRDLNCLKVRVSFFLLSLVRSVLGLLAAMHAECDAETRSSLGAMEADVKRGGRWAVAAPSCWSSRFVSFVVGEIG